MIDHSCYLDKHNLVTTWNAVPECGGHRENRSLAYSLFSPKALPHSWRVLVHMCDRWPAHPSAVHQTIPHSHRKLIPSWV